MKLLHMLRLTLIPALFVSILPAAHSAAGPNMKEGLWEITVKMDMPGMPQAMPPQTTQRCIMGKDMEDPRKVAPGGDPRSASACEVTNYRMQGNTASWNMACKGPEQMSGTGSITYEGNRYSGVNRMSMKQGNEVMQMTMNYSGRFLGECKPASK